jgi:hypothetical protein
LKRVIGALVLALCAFAIGRFVMSPPQSATPAASLGPGAPAVEHVSADPLELTTRSVARVATAPALREAPAADAPQVEQIRYWRAQAAQGDLYARCRYARVARHCALHRDLWQPWARAEGMASMLSSPLGEALWDCGGVEDADTAGVEEALWQSARAGHVPAQVLYAAGGGFASWFNEDRLPQLRRFRADAADLAWRAFAAGDSDAAVLLWRAYNQVDASRLLLAAAIEPDPVKAHALDLLLAELVPEFVAGSAEQAGLDAEQTRAAEVLLAEWQAGAFAHARPPRFGMEIERSLSGEKHVVDLCAPDPR